MGINSNLGEFCKEISTQLYVFWCTWESKVLSGANYVYFQINTLIGKKESNFLESKIDIGLLEQSKVIDIYVKIILLIFCFIIICCIALCHYLLFRLWCPFGTTFC